MKKWVSLIAVLAISGMPLKAEVIQEPTNEVVYEQETVTHLSRAFFNTFLQEQQLGYLIQNRAIDEVPLKEVAYALCDMLNEAGIYLPESEGISDPYISKLVLLGIWQEPNVKAESLVENAAWERTYERALYYQENKQPFELKDSAKEKRMNSYRQKATARSSYKEIEIGKLTLSSQVLAYDAYTYPIYTFSNTSYIDLNTLQALGFTIQKQEQGEVLSFSIGSGQASNAALGKSIAISLSNETIYGDSLKTYTLKGADTLFVPLRALERYFELTYDTAKITLVPLTQQANPLVYEGGLLTNISEEPIEVVTTSFYWDGKATLQEMKRQHLEPGQSIEDPRASYTLKGAYYLNTLVNLIETSSGSQRDQKLYGQQMDPILTAYEKAILAESKKQEDSKQKDETVKQPLFPPTPVYATLKGDVKGLKKGEKVELYREDNGSYTVITSTGNKVTVVRSKLSIPASQKVTAAPASKAQIEAYINTQNISSNTAYLVWTDLYRQTTYVLKGSENQWQLIRRMLCSTGKNQTPTPRGFFTLQNKVPSFGQEKGYCCKNAYGFIGSTYLYHSILYDKTGSYIISGKKELGQKASHGCIRLLPEDSLWLYTNLPKGTAVWIN